MNPHIISVLGRSIPVHGFNTIVIGSGAASLSAADHIHKLGQTDLAVVTGRVDGGVSRNSGSDKQTYYKLSVFGEDGDSPGEMARSLYEGGSMHGDLALVESSLSPRCFFRLVEIGVPFPHGRMGGYVGYKTDHDPRQRATSAGPWTSREMVERLLDEVRRRGIRIFEGLEVVALLVEDGRIYGAAALDTSRLEEPSFGLTLFLADNVVFGVGGPGGLYRRSVYPEGHHGAIGLALEAGARAANLTESQFGLSSTKFRWNVSGTFQQVIPRYFSAGPDGGDEHEFLNPYFPGMRELATAVFLKGYQWPFDCRKIRDHGSSLIDVLVAIETDVKGRRVFMDFRENPRAGEGIGAFSLDNLEPEARDYLELSGARFGRPIDRLRRMNPMAVELYRSNGIDIGTEPLEVAVCAQHNNGGIAVDIWWESSIRHLFPIGEVAGTHGVYRPGGSALNSGQVGSLRAAQRITSVYRDQSAGHSDAERLAAAKAEELLKILERLYRNDSAAEDVRAYRVRFQDRMSRSAAHIREAGAARKALEDAYSQLSEFESTGVLNPEEILEAMRNRHLVLAHTAYIEAIHTYLESGGGSRGSALVLDKTGLPVLEGQLGEWRFKPENEDFRDLVLETRWNGQDKKFASAFVRRRPIPDDDSWFENVWGDYIRGKIFE